MPPLRRERKTMASTVGKESCSRSCTKGFCHLHGRSSARHNPRSTRDQKRVRKMLSPRKTQHTPILKAAPKTAFSRLRPKGLGFRVAID